MMIPFYENKFDDLYAIEFNSLNFPPHLHDLIEVGRPTPAPESITVPMLVIGASAGTFTDALAMRQWVNALKDGQMAVVKCAHWPLTECPRDVADVIEGWVFKRFAPQSAAQASSN